VIVRGFVEVPTLYRIGDREIANAKWMRVNGAL